MEMCAPVEEPVLVLVLVLLVLSTSPGPAYIRANSVMVVLDLFWDVPAWEGYLLIAVNTQTLLRPLSAQSGTETRLFSSSD